MKAGGLAKLLFRAAGAVLLSAAAAYAAAEEAPAGGKEVFLSLKCHLCHSVDVAEIEAKAKSEKVRGPDLSTVGSERDGGWVTAYMKRQETIEGKEHKKEFKGSDEELQAIVDWLLSLAAEP